MCYVEDCKKAKTPLGAKRCRLWAGISKGYHKPGTIARLTGPYPEILGKQIGLLPVPGT